MSSTMILAGEEFDLTDARSIIAGYCFSEETTVPNFPAGDSYGLQMRPWRRSRWGYRAYDCQRGRGPSPDVVDAIAPVLLNVAQGYGVRLVSDLLAVAPRVREIVSSVGDDFTFWNLDPDHVEPTGTPPQGSESQALHQAWYLIESVPGAGLAVTHKLLHHAWPRLFPLIDNETIKVLGDGAWVTILTDLQAAEGPFQELESWFAALAESNGGVELSRLRLYDILLWCRVTEEDEHAKRDGEAFLAAS